MSPKQTKMRLDVEPGSTADIKGRIKIRSDAITAPNLRKKTWSQMEKMLEQWQTRGLYPADDQPAPTKAHRKAVIDHENGEYLREQQAWIKAGQPSWYGPKKIAMLKAETRKAQVTSLMLHLKYSVSGMANMCIVEEASSRATEVTTEKLEDTPVIQTPKLYPDLIGKPPPYVTENKPLLQPSIQAPTFVILGGVLELDGVPTTRRLQELEYGVRMLTTQSNQLLEEHKRLAEKHPITTMPIDSQLQRDILQTPMSFQSTNRSTGTDPGKMAAYVKEAGPIFSLQPQTAEEDAKKHRQEMEDRHAEERREAEGTNNYIIAERRRQQEQTIRGWEDSQSTRRTNYSPDEQNYRGHGDDNDSAHSGYPEQTRQQQGFTTPSRKSRGDEINQQTWTAPMAERLRSTAHHVMPLIAAGKGGFQYQPWNHRDMEALVGKLPPLIKGGQKWVNDLEKFTAQDHLCLGDIRALLGRIEGRLEARAIDSEANCTNDPDDIPFNFIRSNYWAAIRHIYPTTRSFHALRSLKKETGEDMHVFLKKCEEVWEACTGERHDLSPAIEMVWKNSVIKALPLAVQARLEEVVGLDNNTR
ncbi:hypothetical protein CesoFtcFv8_001811 [Champsocephalus esox]|uniref:Uncharacterized protein n=1 Tax=Champsocephalus esox TaxID=159716 RepID=A0AAN8CWW1_9TELE|nr:hypothetical protein CesoFtcFv8_001811 [Champsocephalus esox]